MNLDIYNEVYGNVDRFFLAPPGLGIAEARRQRQGRLYKTREGARRGLVARTDRQRKEQGRVAR